MCHAELSRVHSSILNAAVCEQLLEDLVLELVHSPKGVDAFNHLKDIIYLLNNYIIRTPYKFKPANHLRLAHFIINLING
jgi:hypothetical protein